MKVKKYSCIIISVFLTALFVSCSGLMNTESTMVKSEIEKEFREKTEAFAQSIISGNYDYAIEMPYYLPEHEHLRESYKNSLKNGESHMISFKINDVVKLKDDIYQIDGIFNSSYGYEELLIPFYFYMDGTWHFAMNEFEVPEKYLKDVEYQTFDGALDPDEIGIVDAG